MGALPADILQSLSSIPQFSYSTLWQTSRKIATFAIIDSISKSKPNILLYCIAYDPHSAN